MPIPVPDLIYGALTEIRVARGGDVLRAEDQALGLLLLNEVLERLAVTPNALYARMSTGAALVPGLQPHTIGPSGTFLVPRRPVRIARMNLVFPTGTTRQPVAVLSKAWWMGLATRTLSSSIPEGCYYNPTWPNGELNLFPVPDQPYGLELDVDRELLAVAVTDALDLPQGYSELLRLWTAKKAAPAFAREFSAASEQALSQCLSDVCGTNISVNNLTTLDGGVPGGEGGWFDYRTGEVVG